MQLAVGVGLKVILAAYRLITDIAERLLALFADYEIIFAFLLINLIAAFFGAEGTVLEIDPFQILVVEFQDQFLGYF